MNMTSEFSDTSRGTGKIIQAELRRVPMSALEVSALNPRTDLQEERIAELQGSIREKGFDPAFPLIVRPIAGERYEIAAGQRRFLASKREGLAELPCSVRVMSDLEVLEVGLLENVQRESLSALEEARGYARLMQMGQSVEAIAQALGVSLGHVQKRLMLLRLEGSKVADALQRGEISTKHGLILSSVPSKALREELLEKTLRPAESSGVLSVEELERLIKLDYMRELPVGAFDREDEQLVPVQWSTATGERVAGGKCSDCPHVDRKPRAWLCLNPECLREKEAAAHERWAREAQVPEQNRWTKSFRENNALLNCARSDLSFSAPYVALNEVPSCDDELRRGVENVPTWRKLLKGTDVPVTVLRLRRGDELEVVEREVAIEAARTAELAKPADERVFKPAKVESAMAAKPAGDEDSFPGLKREEEGRRRVEAEAREREAQRRLGVALCRAVEEKGRGLKLPEEFVKLALDALVSCVIEHGDEVELREWMGWTVAKEETVADGVRRHVKALEGTMRHGVLVVLLTLMHLGEARAKAVQAWAKVLGVNVKQVREAVEAEMEAEREEQEQVRASVFPLAWRERKEKAAEFQWNEAGAATNADEGEVAFEAALGVEVKAWVLVARSENGWHPGWRVMWADAADGVQEQACLRIATAYGSRALAVRAALVAMQAEAKVQPEVTEALGKLLEAKPSRPSRSGRATGAAKKGGTK